MLEKFKEWANAGDGGVMYNLAVMYSTGEGVEQDLKESAYWLEKAANSKHIDAMKDFAAKLRTGSDFIEQNQEAAINLYKEVIELYRDEESMEILVEMCAPDDKENLNFVLNAINKMYSEILPYGSSALVYSTLRRDECTANYLRAVERSRIARHICRILNEN